MAVPQVSILIPCYNAERWIAQTLDSALNQSWANKEIIVVDDESTDGSLKVLKGYASRGVKVISQKNRGASAARNRALSEAQGDFIQFLDADDLLDQNKIEVQMKRLLSEPPECVATGAWGRFYDSPHNTTFITDPIWTDLAPVDWLVTSWCGGGMMASHAWLTPRAVIEKAGAWDETPSPIDDGEFFTRVVLNSQRVLFCPEARVYYRSGLNDSWSQRRTPQMLSAIYHSIELSTGHLLDKENNPRTRKACAGHFQMFIYDVYPQMPDLVRRAEAKVKSLGGSDLKLSGGSNLFQFLVQTLGWKPTKHIQLMYRAGMKIKKERKSSMVNHE